ncbi:hypothetical protein J6K59_10630, partial [Leuconostoc mesenteroides]|nr:hypothetical protein [Leuconostoc mesenteroides]
MAGLTESTRAAESSEGAPVDYGQVGEVTEPMRVAVVDQPAAHKKKHLLSPDTRGMFVRCFCLHLTTSTL